MDSGFIPIPDWLPWQNQGAGLAVADLDGSGQPDLIIFQIDNPEGKNQGYYRVGRNLDAGGQVTGGWGPWKEVPDWDYLQNQGSDIAVVDLDGNGRPELIVFQIDNPGEVNRGLYRIGWSLDADANVTGGWGPWKEVPDWFTWENAGGAIAVADLDGNGRPELVVFMIDAPAEANAGYYRIGWSLDADANVTGGWSEWIKVDWFSWENQGAGLAITDLDGNGRPELIIFQIDNPVQQNRAYYQIGWEMDINGHVIGGWSPWTEVLEWRFWENQGSAIALVSLDGAARPQLLIFTIDHPPAGNAGYHRALDLEVDLDRAADMGVWRLLPEDSQVLPIHAALLHTDKVCFFSGSSNNPNNIDTPFRSVVWDFINHSFTRPQLPTDLFCCDHAFLADGQLLVAGGTKNYDFGHPFFGLRDALVLDPANDDTWTPVAQMAGGRWYPTLVTLGDGRVLAVSGLGEDGLLNLVPEIFTPGAGWTVLPDQRTWSGLPGNEHRLPLYAHLFLLRDGRVFYSGGQYGGNEGLPPCVLDLNAHSFMEVTGLVEHGEQAHRNQSASVLLPPAQSQRVMLIGGGATHGGGGHLPAEAINNVNVVDFTIAAPQYRATAALHFARMHHNAVLLPDRTVLVVGGSHLDESREEATLSAELYHPAEPDAEPDDARWDVMAKARVPRLYHSVALLLPDATVITAGSNPARGDEELRLERFYPPYLFKGARPSIAGAPVNIAYGATFEVDSAQANDIRWVNLIRAGSTTHCSDTDQRLVDVPFTVVSGSRLRATLMGERNLGPPGWYMLFLTDSEGRPSTAHWMRIG